MALFRCIGVHTIDQSKTTSLLDIVKLFNCAISEEQAWAICFQCCQSFKRGINISQLTDICNHGSDAIRILSDGTIHIGLHYTPGDTESDTALEKSAVNDVNSEERMLASLGLAVFQALDYGLVGGEERRLSDDLEALIDMMTDSEKCSDEGIEEDHDYSAEMTSMDSVILLFQEHLCHVQDVGDHYQAVCRALITEVTELLLFLDNISDADKDIEDSNTAHGEQFRASWARLWVQVMRQLRRSVRLKKVERCHVHMPPLEYELTPYEMLMDDIRTRRYTLNKIMVNGDVPIKEHNDGHEVILAFIRSRPPLNSAKLRVLNKPPEIVRSPVEKLLDEIRSGPALKPVTEGRPRVYERSRTKLFDLDDLSSDEDSTDSATPVRRLIKPDIDLQKLLESSIEDDSDDDDLTVDTDLESSRAPTPTELRPQLHSTPQSARHSAPLYDHTPPQHRPDKPTYNSSPCGNALRRGTSPAIQRVTDPCSWKKAVVDDLVLGIAPNRLKRRHSITVCESLGMKVDKTRWSSRRWRTKPLNISESIPEHESEGDTTHGPHASRPCDTNSPAIYHYDNPAFVNGQHGHVRSTDACVALNEDRARFSSSSLCPSSHDSNSVNSSANENYSFDDITHLIHNATDVEVFSGRGDYTRSSSSRSRATIGTNDFEPTNTSETYGSKREFCYRSTPNSARVPRDAGGGNVSTSGGHGDAERVFDEQVDTTYSPASSDGKMYVKDTKPRENNATVYRVDSDFKHDLTNKNIDSRTNDLHKHNNNTQDNINHNINNNNDNSTTDRITVTTTDHVTKTTSIDALSNQSDLDLTASSDLSHTQWKNPMECLSLTLEEVMHIRMVLTKAEIDGLLSNPTLYTLISKEKICFSCKDTRFTFFGEWGSKCRFCKRTVCNKCLRKLNIPTEHFGTIPVYTLTPERRVNRIEQDLITKHHSTGSQPPSPTSPRRASTPTNPTTPARPLHRSHTVTARSVTLQRRPQMSVCRDCRDLVCEIIRVSRVALALTATSSSTEGTTVPLHPT